MTSSINSYQTVSVESSLSRPAVRERLFGALSCDIDICAPKNLMVAVVLVDLKSFHEVNVRYGFELGDEVLTTIQRRFATQLNKASIVARVESNTYAIIIPDLKSAAFLELAANKIRSIVKNSLEIGDYTVRLECHIGAAVYPTSEMTPEKLFMQAEKSLRTVKQHDTKNLIVPKMGGEDEFTISDIERGLIRAIEHDELQFYYQPKVNLITQQVDSAEALMRWNSERMGFVTPDKFIPIAEQSNLIRKLTDWGIKTAMREKASLDQTLPNFSLSVNLSAKDLYDNELVYVIDSAREIWSIEPDTIVLEITEGVILENQSAAFEQLRKLKDRGIRISLDDFGTGYSSLSYFKNIPADEVKIDRSFVTSLCENKDDASIVELIISLAKKFNLSVVAEGIEDRKTLDRVIEMGCDYAQGYYYSRPVALDQFIEWSADFNSCGAENN